MRVKKLIAIVFSALLSVSIFTACGKKDAFSEEEKFECGLAGLIFYVSQEYQDKGFSVDYPMENEKGYNTVSLCYYNFDFLDKLYDEVSNLSEEERTDEVINNFYDQVDAHSRCLMNFVLVEENEYNDAINNGKVASDFSDFDNAEKFATNDGYVYLISVPESNSEGLDAQEKIQYEECLAYLETVKKNMEFIDILTLPEKMPEFTANDLYGNTVTNNIFSDKDLTVVNVWGTFCNPCIGEMPELGEWFNSMPDNVQIIGLISDVDENDEEGKKLARSIMEEAGADFINIIPNDNFDLIMDWVTGVPTTFFVDKMGNVVGEPIVGANVEGYKKFVEEYLSE